MIPSAPRNKPRRQSSLPDESRQPSLLLSLNRERKRLRAVFNLLHEAVLLVDAKGKISFYNRAAQQLLALPEKSKRLPRLWHWIPALKNFFTQTDPEAHPDILTTETELIYPEKRFVRLRLQPFSEADGKSQFVVLLQDITQERTNSEERLFQGCLDSVTQLASELAHELGNPLNAIGIHLQLIQRALREFLANTADATRTETSFECPTTTDATVPDGAVVVSGNGTTPTSVARKTLHKRSERNTDGKTALNASGPNPKAETSTAVVPIPQTILAAMHEKSSPLQPAASPQATELRMLWQSLSVCRSEVRRLDTLIQQFLKSVRPQSLPLKRGNVLEVLKKVLAVLKPQLDDAHIAIELHISGPLSSIFMDADRLHQAFFNVLKNAREAVGTNGKIMISCGQDEQYLILSFADTGGGFPEAQAIQSFPAINTTQKPNGHGIGMLMVQRIMREHHGFVEIQTKASVGSVVSLKFPLPEPMTRKLAVRKTKGLKKEK